jgi:hypothetical protein
LMPASVMSIFAYWPSTWQASRNSFIDTRPVEKTVS